MAFKIDNHKVGNNDPCPCGAKGSDGRPIKFKKCCKGRFIQNTGLPTPAFATPEEVIESERGEVERFLAAMQEDPTLIPGDTIIALARKHQIFINDEFTPKPPEVPHGAAMAMLTTVGMFG